ncbi:Athe_2463 domain-containing protein, partial [Thermincola ferriacetica]|uniref:Athe_2463 domain-containing protein n=1 Tax=Thermincola ferriacetica TaxID=281456 RepID=UPI000A562075
MQIGQRNLVLFMVLVAMFGFAGLTWGNTEKYVPPVKAPLTITEAKIDDNKFLKVAGSIPIEYFVDNPQTKAIPENQRFLNIEVYPEFNNTHLLFYGSPHGRPGEKPQNGEYRYSGYNRFGEHIPNLNWPNDVQPKNKYLDDNKWISHPWTNPNVIDWNNIRGEKIVHVPYFEPKPEWRQNIWWGLKLMHGDEFRGDETVPWEQYVHVLQPPTFWGWGWGIAWHDEHDGQGILYRTIPIAPESVFVDWVPNLYVKDFDPGTPVETDPTTGATVYTAEPFTRYTATVTFGIAAENEWIKRPPPKLPIFIGAAHQIDQTHHKAVLKYKSGRGSIGGLISAFPWGAPVGYKYQTVTFNANRAEIVAQFDWTAQPQSKSLTVGVNDWPGFRYLYEGDTGLVYADNRLTVPLTVKPLPDAYVANINPGTALTEPGREYHGTVTYGLKANFPGPVEVKLGLTHNGWPVSGIHERTVALKPGETITLPFTWHGQKMGQNSLIEAKIWPQEPTLKDINWQNNTRRVLIKSHVTDIAVTSI